MKRFLVFLGCVMFLLFSCSREPDQEQPKPNDPVVEGWEETVIDGDGELASSLIHFSIGQDSAAVMRGTASFDGATYTFTVGDRITIALTRDGVETKKVYKVKTTAGDLEYDGDAADAFHWKNKSETIKIRAWSYGSSTSFSTEPVGNTFTLATTQSANYQELLYSPADDYSYGSDGSISLSLYHQLSRVTIQLTQSKSNPEDPLTVNSITFGNGTLYTKGKFVAPASEGVTIGSWTNFTEASGTITPYHDDTYKYSAVMFPHHLAAGTTLFTIVTPDGTFAYKVPSGDGITLEAGKQYNYTINVRDLVAVSTLTIGDIAAYTYDGTAKEPTPTVTDPVSGKVLTKGTHYTLSWSNNVNAGTATCTVTGLGIYSGTQNKTFTINPKALTSSELYFASSAITRTYIWELGTGTNALTKPSNCTVTYTSSNTSVATVNSSTGVLTPGGTLATNTTITATATGNYTGTATYTIKATSKEKTYSFTGGIQSDAICPGVYTLEAWGAQGGSLYATGGKGGYATGRWTCTSATNIYVGVGGSPGTTTGAGYNGAGGSRNGSSLVYKSGGGGGTHIAYGTVNRGLMKNYADYTNELLIIAGGGGGGTKYYSDGTPMPGGAGGGTTVGNIQHVIGQGTPSTIAGTATAPLGEGGGDGTGSGYKSGTFQESSGHVYSGNGGTGYVKSGLTNSSQTTGSRSGNGQAKITWVSN